MQKQEPVDQYGFLINTNDPFDNDDCRQIRDEKKLITTGNWVIIIKTPQVTKSAQPVLYGIYWAVPYIRIGKAGKLNNNKFYDSSETETKQLIGVDEYHRQCALIYTPEEVRIFTDEYSVLSEEKFKNYKSIGWYMQEINAKAKCAMNLELINKGRSLTEEEREIIWAFMLDGLSEQQSCEEYFLTHHTEYDNTDICYLPTQDIINDLYNVFGDK